MEALQQSRVQEQHMLLHLPTTAMTYLSLVASKFKYTCNQVQLYSSVCNFVGLPC